MTRKEKSSNRRKLALFSLVKKGEESPASALDKTEDLHDAGKLTESDYEELAEFLENLLNEEENEEVVAENEPTENTEEEAE